MASRSRLHFIIALLAGCAAGGSRHLDVVASAAFERALESGDRSIYSALLDERFRGSVCSVGPTEFSCQDEARVRLAILDCRDQAETEQVLPSHEELSARILDGIRRRDREALARFAACDFETGPCGSDDVQTRLPGAAIDELLAVTPPLQQLMLAEAAEGRADYVGDPGGRLRIQLEVEPESFGWGWSGFCWSGGK